MTDSETVLTASGGWCAPNDNLYLGLFDPAGIRNWPRGLHAEDLDWLAEQLMLADIDPDPVGLVDEMPSFSIRRGGVKFPLPGTATVR